MEAATGFEPVIRALQARALPLGYAAEHPFLYESSRIASSEPGLRGDTRDRIPAFPDPQHPGSLSQLEVLQ